MRGGLDFRRDPVGKRIRISVTQQLRSTSSDEVFTIVGVIGDTMNRGPALPPMPHITTLFRQTPDLNVGFKTLLVRTKTDPLQMADSVRQQLRSLDPNLPFAEVATIDELLAAQTADRRYTTGLLALFSAFGLALAGIGVYGVISYIVARQTSEIGVRIGLGAQREDVLWMMLKQGISMAGTGAVLGLIAAFIAPFRRAIGVRNISSRSDDLFRSCRAADFICSRCLFDSGFARCQRRSHGDAEVRVKVPHSSSAV